MNFDLAQGLLILERTPGVVRALLAGLPADWTAPNEGPETWSAFDVVGHLIEGEETDWMVRARIIRAQGPDRRFVPFDRSRHLGANRGRSLEELLDRFAVLRTANLTELRGMRLSSDDLALTGVHPEFGSVTLGQLLATWVVHDLGHVAQIGRVMAKQYRAAVGPWEAYLPVLHR